MILLDTNAMLWLHHGHRRARRLERGVGQIYASPAGLLEIQFLLEIGKLRLRSGATVRELANDEHWLMDNPPSVDWFERALDISWTRDPFDRLLVAHAAVRGWRVATADGEVLQRLGPRGSIEL